MFGTDKIALIRRAHFGDGKKIKEIVRELAVSRKVVRKVVRSGATEFAYTRQVQPRWCASAGSRRAPTRRWRRPAGPSGAAGWAHRPAESMMLALDRRAA